MSTSSLDPDLIPGKDRQLGKGHGIGALGPSDLSDSGSDMAGGPGWQSDSDFDLGLDSGTNSDAEEFTADTVDDVDGDATDSGEQMAHGHRAKHAAGRDIDTDRVARLSDVADPDGIENADDDDARI
jgi:hypothetical protein